MIATAVVATSAGIGGRSLRTQTDTERMRLSAARMTSLMRCATRSSNRCDSPVTTSAAAMVSRAVVDAVLERVGGPGRGQIELDVEVDLERLLPLPLLGEHADHAEGAQPPDLDAVGHTAGTLSGAPGPGHRRVATRPRPNGSSCLPLIRSMIVTACGPSGTRPAQRM